MFEDQLLQVPRFQHDGEFVEAANLTGKFDTADQVDRHIDPIPAESIEEAVLYVLSVLRVHISQSPLSVNFFLLLLLMAFQPGSNRAQY